MEIKRFGQVIGRICPVDYEDGMNNHPCRNILPLLTGILFVAIPAATCPIVGHAAEEDKTRFFQATFENDLFFDTDRYYSG
jgi:hypothetical protein